MTALSHWLLQSAVPDIRSLHGLEEGATPGAVQALLGLPTAETRGDGLTARHYLLHDSKPDRLLDEAHDSPRRVSLRHVQANLLFLAGFAVMAAVVNVMLTKRLPWADASPGTVLAAPAASTRQMTPVDPR